MGPPSVHCPHVADAVLVSQLLSRAALRVALFAVTRSCAWPVHPVSRSMFGREMKLSTAGNGLGSTHVVETGVGVAVRTGVGVRVVVTPPVGVAVGDGVSV